MAGASFATFKWNDFVLRGLTRPVGALAPACVAVLLLMIGCGGSSSPPSGLGASTPVSVKVQSVARGAVASLAEAVGTVQSKTVAAVQSKIIGQVTAVHVKEGDTVTLDTLLVEIDDRDARAQLLKAQSALAEAQKALQETADAIGAAESAKAEADAASALAATTYNRYKNLAENSAISRQAFDEADSKYKQATAAAARADQMLKSVQAKKGQAEAAVQQATAGLDAAQVGMTYTKIMSPVDGLVTAKSVNVGDMAAPGSTLLQIEDHHSYRLEANVNETQVARIKVGDQVPVVIDALAGEAITGTVAEIVPMADPSSRTSIVKANLPNLAQLRSGMFGRIRFSAGERQALTVPASATFEKGQLTGVYVVDQYGTARLRLIKLGNRYGDLVEVLSGLNEGDRVVVENVSAVSDGARIESL